MAQSPFLDPNSQEILGLQRQQKLADLLSQKGMEQPEGGMVSGHYVAPSFTQMLNPLLNAYQGRKLSEGVEQKSKQLADMLRGQKSESLNQFATLMQTDPTKAYQFAMQSDIPELAQAGFKGIMPEEYNLGQGETRYRTTNGVTTSIAQNAPKEEKPPASYQEYQYAKKEGYKGTYSDYQNDDANRKRPVVNVNTVNPNDAIGQGKYTPKGDYIAPGGIFIGKPEVAKDREIVKTANDVINSLNDISQEDIKKSSTVFGDVTQGGIKSYIAKQTGNEAVAAQNKINASAVMQLLQNLPPGPASDKDIAMAKSTIPGYGDANALNAWIKNTKAMLLRKVDSTNEKYGSSDWYGAKSTVKSTQPNNNQSDGFSIREKK